MRESTSSIVGRLLLKRGWRYGEINAFIRCYVSQVYNVLILEDSIDMQLVRVLVGCVSRNSHDSFFSTAETPP